ncbi:MAG TPA: type II toxin-antitoxin system HicA family toxin [Dehalococcoidia bacterium]|nr:type II toxin-antitoxin system HicA family toxin [Dehalococcoidia bacterium]
MLSGDEVVGVLAKLGYEVRRIRGSHMRLVAAGRPPLSVPRHSELDQAHSARSFVTQT